MTSYARHSASQPSTENEPPMQPPLAHILAGAGAAGVAAIATSPLDVLRIRMQYQTPSHPEQYLSIRDGLLKIYRNDGVRGYFKGLGPSLIALLPTWAVYFTTYEESKEYLHKKLSLPKTDPKIHIASAMVAGCASTTVTAPLWLIKARLVTQSNNPNSPYYHRHTVDAFRTILRVEGVKGLYKGLSASLLGTVHVAIQFPIYEKLKVVFKPKGTNQGEVSTVAVFAASSISKAVASVAWYPHEVIRTRMQTQEPGLPKYRNLWDCCVTIVRTEGIGSLYRGLGTNLVRAIPACALTFTSYELLLKILTDCDLSVSIRPSHGHGDRLSQ